MIAKVGRRAHNILIVTEGLLIYLDEADVASLAQDLAWSESVRHWIFDLVSPALLKRRRQAFGRSLVDANAPLKFGAASGVRFFEPFGWRAVEGHSLLKTAATLKRLPWYYWLFTLIPDKQPPGKAPWSGVCLMERNGD